MSEIVMQEKCVNCKREQYGPAVYSISYGESGCVWCDHVSKEMTQKEYIEELKK